jgi:hypothetical protein
MKVAPVVATHQSSQSQLGEAAELLRRSKVLNPEMLKKITQKVNFRFRTESRNA